MKQNSMRLILSGLLAAAGFDSHAAVVVSPGSAGAWRPAPAQLAADIQSHLGGMASMLPQGSGTLNAPALVAAMQQRIAAPEATPGQVYAGLVVMKAVSRPDQLAQVKAYLAPAAAQPGTQAAIAGMERWSSVLQKDPGARTSVASAVAPLQKIIAESGKVDRATFEGQMQALFDGTLAGDAYVESKTAAVLASQPAAPAGKRQLPSAWRMQPAPKEKAAAAAAVEVPAPGGARSSDTPAEAAQVVVKVESEPTTRIPNTAEELMEMFANSKSTVKNLSPEILRALAARHGLGEEEMKRRIANIVKMYPLLESQKAANTTLRALFVDQNKAQPQHATQLSRVTHESWLDNEKTQSTFISYTAELHGLLREHVKVGGVLVPTAPIKDQTPLTLDLFENPKKKYKFQAKHFVFKDDTQKARFAAAFLAATGRKFEGDSWVVNTVAGQWDALVAIEAEHAPEAWRAGRLNFLNGLQEDNVASVLTAVHTRKIMRGLATARTPDEFMNVIVDMSRVLNVGWRLNNPWFGFGYKLQYRPFHPDPNIGIGIEEIRKDTITLKAALEVLRNPAIAVPKDVRAALDAAFARGLGSALEEAVKPDARALSQGILKQNQEPVKLAADQSNILEYLAWIFSRQDLIDQHMSGDALEVLARAFDKKGKADVVRSIENALAILEVLKQTQDSNDAAHTALAPRVPTSIRTRLANTGHAWRLAHERTSLGKRFVEYSPKLHALLLESADSATIEHHGRRLTSAALADPKRRFRLTAANFKRTTEAERAAFAAFEKRFVEITGESFSDPDGEPLVELNTWAAGWAALASLVPAGNDRKEAAKWTRERNAALYDYQAHGFTPVFTALFDDRLVAALGQVDEATRQDALLRILRRIDTNTRLDDPDMGFSRLKLSYDVTSEGVEGGKGGIGIDHILQDVALLNSALRTITVNLDALDLPESTRVSLRAVLGTRLLASARALADRDTLVQVLQRNRVRENFTLDAVPEPAK